MRPALLSALILLSACRPVVTIEYMYPAEFSLPQEVQTVAVIDRANRGESAGAVAGLEDALLSSPRLKVASPSAARAATGKITAPLGEQLGRADAENVCKTAAATGVVTLDGYAHEGGWSYSETTEEITEKVSEKPANCADCPPVEKEVTRTVPVVVAHYNASTTTSWSVQTCQGLPLTGKSMVTSSGLEGRGDRQGDAREDAGDPKALEGQMARSAGYGFSTHISPREVSEPRQYFKGGSSIIREGARFAKEGDWEMAAAAWREGLSKDESEKDRGKTRLNLAVAAEKKGDINQALEHARKAKQLLGGKKGTTEYVDTLMRRQGLENKVQEQLPPAAPAVPAPAGG